MKIAVGARSSPLSRVQLEEVQNELDIELDPVFVETVGDLDRATSLRSLDKTDFFTREIDQLLLSGRVRIAIHSAKDLPEPLPDGLALVALTAGKDPRDSLVLRSHETLETLPPAARIATCSTRREKAVRQLRSDLTFVDLRGTIAERLSVLERKEIHGVVIAEAALVRLKLTHLNRYFLPGDAATHQGRLAIVARKDDEEMRSLFSRLDAPEKPWRILHLGLDPTACPSRGQIWHYPVIRIVPKDLSEVRRRWPDFTHVICTSQSVIDILPRDLSWDNKTAIAIGRATASRLSNALIAATETQEGVIALLKQMDLSGASIFYPRSSRARPLLADYLRSTNHWVCDLYDTVLHQPGAPPSLNDIDEIVFMSPSCVEGFLKIYGSLPTNKKLTAQGPITLECLRKTTAG